MKKPLGGYQSTLYLLNSPGQLASLAESDVAEQICFLLRLVGDLGVVPVVQQRVDFGLDFLHATLQKTVLINIIVLDHEFLGLANPGNVLLVDRSEVRVGNAVGRRNQNGYVDVVLISNLFEVEVDEETLVLFLEHSVQRLDLLEVVFEHFEDLLKDEFVLLLGSQRLGHFLVQDILEVFGQSEGVQLRGQSDAELPLDDCSQDFVLCSADETVFVVQLFVIEELEKKVSEIVAAVALTLIAFKGRLLVDRVLGNCFQSQGGLLGFLVNQKAELLD